MLGVGGLGILWGAKVQSGLDEFLRPVTLNDQTGLTSFLPSSERFRIYSVTGTLPSRTDADYRLTLDGAVDRTVEHLNTLERLGDHLAGRAHTAMDRGGNFND